MSISLNTIKPAKGATKNRKRIGRGNGSGIGTYSGKGLKGQKARSGVSNLKRLGMKPMLLQIPKVRGFKSKNPDNQVVLIADINKNFKDGAVLNCKTLLKNKLIAKINLPVKILGKEELTVKNLTIEGISVSESAKKQIEEKGGKIK